MSQLAECVETRNRAGFRSALKEILRAGPPSVDDMDTLKRIALFPPILPGDPFAGNPTLLSMTLFLGDQQINLQRQARIALVALGGGHDPKVLELIISSASNFLLGYGPGYYANPPVDFLLLVALNSPKALPTLAFFMANAPFWSFRIACLYRLPESRRDGNFKLIESFRNWILSTSCSDRAKSYDWSTWQAFASCMRIDSLRDYSARVDSSLPAPIAQHTSALIDWALEQGLISWLTTELSWLCRGGGYGGECCLLRNRLVEAGVPAAVELCCRQIQNAKFEDLTHYDVIHNALRLHPKPLPRYALDACVEVIRRPSHPTRYQHRIEALQLLVDGAEQNAYPKSEVQNLVLHLAKAETDPDVRAAAIELVPWVRPDCSRELLDDALNSEAATIREAAKRALAKVS